jgi:hypothetical protein
MCSKIVCHGSLLRWASNVWDYLPLQLKARIVPLTELEGPLYWLYSALIQSWMLRYLCIISIPAFERDCLHCAYLLKYESVCYATSFAGVVVTLFYFYWLLPFISLALRWLQLVSQTSGFSLVQRPNFLLLLSVYLQRRFEPSQIGMEVQCIRRYGIECFARN